MALTLSQGTQFRNNAGYRDRVYSAMTKYALTVMAEALNAGGQSAATVGPKRKQLATKVLVSPSAWIEQFLAVVAGDPGATLNWFQPSVISSSTNANPSVVTTTQVHSLTAGDVVEILNPVGNTAIAGVWTIATVGSTTTFTVPGPSNGSAGTLGGTVMEMVPDADLNTIILSQWNAMANTGTWDV